MTESVLTISEQVAAMHEANGVAASAPGTNVDVDESAALSARQTPEGVLSLGSVFPDGNLLDVEGGPTSVREVRDGRAAVIVFYRGAWCPYCNLTLRTYQDQMADELEAAGVSLMAISPQKPDGSLTMKEKHELRFAVLSDPGNQIAGALGILTTPTEEYLANLRSHGLDLSEVNADGTPVLPMPTVAIVDRTGSLIWIDVHPNYETRTEPAEILAAARSLELG